MTYSNLVGRTWRSRAFIALMLSVVALVVHACVPDGEEGIFGVMDPVADGKVRTLEWDGRSDLTFDGFVRSGTQTVDLDIMNAKHSRSDMAMRLPLGRQLVDAAEIATTPQGDFYRWAHTVPGETVLEAICDHWRGETPEPTIYVSAVVRDSAQDDNWFRRSVTNGGESMGQAGYFVEITTTSVLDCEGISFEEYETYYDVDPLGSPVVATDEDGDLLWRAEFTPFGRPSSAGAAPDLGELTYTGARHDEVTGLVDLGARQYNPDIGRFYGMDPAGFREADILSFNQYVYANNNPYKYVDPQGDIPVETVWDAFNVGIGFSSLVANVAIGNWVGVAVDAGGLIVDGVATVVPYVPGGAGSAIRAYRAADATVDVVKRTTDVYRSVNAVTDTINYVGITNKFARRAAEHMRSKGIDIVPVLEGLARSDARAVEQALIEIHGLGKNGGTLLNKINSISNTNPKYADALARGYEILLDAVAKTGDSVF